MAEDIEHDFWNLLDNLKTTVTVLVRLGIRTLVYAGDYTKAFEVEGLITELLANIDSLIEAAKAVQDVSRPITEEILTVSLYLRNRMFQYQSDLRRCMDGSEDDIAVHHPRNIYSRTIPLVRDKAQEYSAIFDNLRFKVEAESEMQKQQDPRWADNEPEVIDIAIGNSEKQMSKPLSSAKWAFIFGVSRSTMRRWRKENKYPFVQISERKWSLPIQKLPGEYLQKYQQHSKPTKT